MPPFGDGAAPPPRFYPDDPLSALPAPLPVEGRSTALSALLETINNNEDHRAAASAGGVLEARGINTLGEVMDGDWREPPRAHRM